MSWFGETFGDSLNSLKGQITKITKEVLADEETVSEEAGPSSLVVKELEALCESKDLEIASLREEFNILHKQYQLQIESLKRQNNKIESDGDSAELQGNTLSSLEKELVNLRQERDHLNSCLDELQAEHQINLNQAISIKDKYKTDFEDLKKEYDSICAKLKEVTLKEAKCDEKIENKINVDRSENNAKLIEQEPKDTENQAQLKEQVSKLLADIDVLDKIKLKTEKENKSLKNENEDLKNKISQKEKTNRELEMQLKLLLNEKDELMRKHEENSESKFLEAINQQVEVEIKVKDLLKVFYEDTDSSAYENNIFKLLSVIENECKSLQKKEEVNKKLKETISNLEAEIKTLKNDNNNIQIDFKTSNDKWIETEKKYQEEIASLKNAISEMKTQRQDCINESQTDDVKRLEQEIAQFMNLLLTKNNEIKEYSRSISSLEQECINLKVTLSNVEQELSKSIIEKSNLEKEIEQLKNLECDVNQQKASLEEKQKVFEQEHSQLSEQNNILKTKIIELEREVSELRMDNTKTQTVQQELDKIQISKTELENTCTHLQRANLDLKKELENIKAQVIIKESSLSDLMKSNMALQEEINKLRSLNNELQSVEKEIKKWKDMSIDLEIQRQDLIMKKEEIENECLRLRSEVELSAVKDAEILQLKQTNASLVESCNRMHRELESKIQSEQVNVSETNELEAKCQKQNQIIVELQEENNELKSRIHKFQEQMKLQMVQSQTQNEVQQHRRSKSDVHHETTLSVQKVSTSDEVCWLKQALQQEQTKYRSLQNQHQEILDKEASARKEFERLKQHLLEIEEHYTQESIENGKVIDDLKAKLVAAEEQLQNSSTLYTSMKVRDNQHLESLQAQIRLMTTQRDEFQAKLSIAEDEVQKHKASLMSLQIVLEQFQQDKEREVETIAMKYEHQLQLTHGRFKELETEIEGLKKQLSEAKNGLKAASRLGEQLEKEYQLVSELEGTIAALKEKVLELENSLAIANQSNNGKIDKSLIKNLVVGYILSPSGDRKTQVLRIMASVLEFDSEERNKMGVDNTNSGWLSSILHPKGGGPPSSQSLSEAFIKFLENESRPQPKVKFHPEQFQASKPKATSSSPKSPGRISELMLPTFSSSQENESSVILKSVLKDS